MNQKLLFIAGTSVIILAFVVTVVLYQQQVSARQTLERLCGNTGLRYEITDEGVRISGPEGPPHQTLPPLVLIIGRPQES